MYAIYVCTHQRVLYQGMEEGWLQARQHLLLVHFHHELRSPAMAELMFQLRDFQAQKAVNLDKVDQVETAS